jgi:hypothetical protein
MPAASLTNSIISNASDILPRPTAALTQQKMSQVILGRPFQIPHYASEKNRAAPKVPNQGNLSASAQPNEKSHYLNSASAVVHKQPTQNDRVSSVYWIGGTDNSPKRFLSNTKALQ